MCVFVSLHLPPKRIAALAVCAAVLVCAFAWPTPAVPVSGDSGTAVPIVMYHGLLRDPARQGAYIIDPALFESDLAWLRDNGYTAVTVADLVAYVQSGTPLPARCVMLTFDDGLYNNYLYAFPLLERYGMKAVLSPIVRQSEIFSGGDSGHANYSYVTWGELREMAASGRVELGCHSYDMHTLTGRRGILRRADESEADYIAALTADIRRAQDLLYANTGVRPLCFTYPFGAVSKQAPTLLRQMGFAATLGCEEKVNRITRNPESLYGLGRYRRPHDMSSAQFFEQKIGLKGG